MLAPPLLSVNNSGSAVVHPCKLTKAAHHVYGSTVNSQRKRREFWLRRDIMLGGLLEVIA
ncbi:hypothetical protein BKA93DRAFT_785529 [Sparassis latifolia]